MGEHDRLRIAQLANFVGPVSGGIRTALDQLGAGYAAAGAERILVVPGRHDEVEESETGIVVRVRAPRISGGYRMIAQPGRALDVLQQFGPTSVEVSDKWTLSPVAGWARRRGIASVLFSHERLDHQLASFLRRPQTRVPGVRTLNQRLARSFDAVVVTSQFAAAEWESTRARITRVPLAADLDTFSPAAGSQVADGVLKLVLVSRLSPEKTPELAVATALELDRRGVAVRLDVYGTGPMLSRLRGMAADGPVVFHGHVGSRDELARRLAGADVALSLCPVETFGLAVLEALACGVPVVTAERGGARELVTDSSGEWGAPDPVSLADAVLRLRRRSPEQWRRGARRQAERYTWQVAVTRLLALHRRLAEEASHRPRAGAARRWLVSR